MRCDRCEQPIDTATTYYRVENDIRPLLICSDCFYHLRVKQIEQQHLELVTNAARVQH